MTELWLALLPILLAMLISPARTIAVILLLHTPKGARTAFAYVSGMVTSMMVQGIILGFLLSVVGLAMDSREGDLALVVSVLFVVVGIVMLTGSSKFIFQEEDDDKPPPKWLEQLESLEPRTAFAAGFGWLMVSPKQWVFVLTAVAVIFAANLSVVGSLINFFLFSVLIQVVYLVLIAIYLLMPERSEAILDSLFKWLKRNLRVVAIVIFVGFGLFFLIKGLMGLAG
jgi:threonine/homoserine/homoserine lactone efflux protein